MRRGRGGREAARRGSACAGILLACAALVGACGSSSSATKNLDIARVEHAIERSIMQQRHLHSSVICPPKVPQKPGKFACVATTISREKPHREVKTPFLVTIHNDKGWVSYIGEKPVSRRG
jgi:hypothetical protein